MSDDLEAILTTIGQKFDMSFDQKQPITLQPNPQNQKTINPENISQQFQLPQVSNQNSQNLQQLSDQLAYQPNNQAPASALQLVHDQKEVIIPFLPLFERDQIEQNDEQQTVDKPPLQEGETAGLFEGEEEQLQYYRSLSQKFDDVLNKANSRKSFSYFQGQFIERQQHFQKKKQSGLNRLIMQKEKRQSRHFQAKPLINSYSQQMLSFYTPLQKRYPAVIAEKKRKVELWQAELKKKSQEQELQEQQQILKWNQTAKNRVGQVRSNEQYYQYQQKWSQNRYKTIEEKAKHQIETIKVDFSFRPKINQHSDNMMKKKGDRIPIYEKQPELKKPPADPNCTFKPNLSKTMKK